MKKCDCSYRRFVGTYGHDRCYKGMTYKIFPDGVVAEYTKKCSWLRRLICGKGIDKPVL
jgi:hypothetical protein